MTKEEMSQLIDKKYKLKLYRDILKGTVIDEKPAEKVCEEINGIFTVEKIEKLTAEFIAYSKFRELRKGAVV